MPKKVEPTSAFGRRLHALRRTRGLTQTELADAIGSSQRAISHYETIADYPPAAVIVELARVLHVSLGGRVKSGQLWTGQNRPVA